MERDRTELYKRIAEMTNGKLFKPTLGKKILFGNTGPDLIFDCIASEKTIDDSLHLVKNNGRIVAVGLGYTTTKKVDWAIQIYKEITIAGTMMHGQEEYNGKKINSFDLALEFLSQKPELYTELVTHKFPIDDFKKAIKLSYKKGKNKAIKVVLDYR